MVTQEAFLTRLNALPGSVLLTDANAKVLYANKALENRNGFSPSEIFEKRPADAWGRRMNTHYYRWFWQQLQATTQMQSAIKNCHANGHIFTETLHIIPFHLQDQTYYLELQPERNDKRDFETDFTRNPIRSFSTFEKLFSDYFTEIPATDAHGFVKLLLQDMRDRHASRFDDRDMIHGANSQEKAFSQLYARYHDEVLRYFQARMDTCLAQECTQDVFLKAWRHFERYEPRASYRTYLKRLAHNHFVDHLRKDRDLGNAHADLACRPKSILQTEYQLLLDTLSEKERDLLTAHYLHGYKLKEIAQHWQTTENAIKLRLSRLRRRLRKQN